MASFFGRREGDFEPLVPQILLDFAEILNKGSLPVRETQCLKIGSKLPPGAASKVYQKFSHIL